MVERRIIFPKASLIFLVYYIFFNIFIKSFAKKGGKEFSEAA